MQNHRDTVLIRNNPPVGLYNKPMPRALCWSWGGGDLMSKVPLYDARADYELAGPHSTHPLAAVERIWGT